MATDNQTLAALPRIIEGCASAAYSVSGMPELLGVSRDDLMPPILNREYGTRQRQRPWIPRDRRLQCLRARMFLLAIVLSFARLVLIVTLALYEYLTAKTRHAKRITARCDGRGSGVQ